MPFPCPWNPQGVLHLIQEQPYPTVTSLITLELSRSYQEAVECEEPGLAQPRGAAGARAVDAGPRWRLRRCAAPCLGWSSSGAQGSLGGWQPMYREGRSAIPVSFHDLKRLLFASQAASSVIHVLAWLQC